MDPLKGAMQVSGTGLALQSLRMRVISENMANAQVAPSNPGEEPFQRKYVSFASVIDRQSGITSVRLNDINSVNGEFRLINDPDHIAADENGMVKMPDVDLYTEMADLRETVRSYEANMNAIRQAREMINMAIGMMKG